MYAAYKTVSAKKKWIDKPSVQRTARLLQRVYNEEPFETELLTLFGDVPGQVRPKPEKQGNCKGYFYFHTASHPHFCDVALPVGIRPSLGEGDIEDRLGLQDEAFRGKTNRGVWRGSSWPAARCGKAADSPRSIMVQASRQHPKIIDAAFVDSKHDPNRLDLDAVLRHRFLMTSAPSCTYTGRVLKFLFSNSVVTKFGPGFEVAGQPLYGGLQDGVHLKLLTKQTASDKMGWLQTLRSMQAKFGFVRRDAKKRIRLRKVDHFCPGKALLYVRVTEWIPEETCLQPKQVWLHLQDMGTSRSQANQTCDHTRCCCKWPSCHCARIGGVHY